jgi:hypothetical protein
LSNSSTPGTGVRRGRGQWRLGRRQSGSRPRGPQQGSSGRDHLAIVCHRRSLLRGRTYTDGSGHTQAFAVSET